MLPAADQAGVHASARCPGGTGSPVAGLDVMAAFVDPAYHHASFRYSRSATSSACRAAVAHDAAPLLCPAAKRAACACFITALNAAKASRSSRWAAGTGTLRYSAASRPVWPSHAAVAIPSAAGSRAHRCLLPVGKPHGDPVRPADVGSPALASGGGVGGQSSLFRFSGSPPRRLQHTPGLRPGRKQKDRLWHILVPQTASEGIQKGSCPGSAAGRRPRPRLQLRNRRRTRRRGGRHLEPLPGDTPQPGQAAPASVPSTLPTRWNSPGSLTCRAAGCRPSPGGSAPPWSASSAAWPTASKPSAPTSPASCSCSAATTASTSSARRGRSPQ